MRLKDIGILEKCTICGRSDGSLYIWCECGASWVAAFPFVPEDHPEHLEHDVSVEHILSLERSHVVIR